MTVEIKEYNEIITKKEIRDRIRWNVKHLRRIANGTASDYDTMDYIAFYCYRDDAVNGLKELKERGYTKLDEALHESVYNNVWNAEKALDVLLGN